jgi:arylsulfatase A-like enzyme
VKGHPDTASRRPNFLIIDVDTLSTSRVGKHRGGASITPVLDRLGLEGLRYSEAFSQSGWTLPALTALLTGRHPVPMREHSGTVSWREAGTRDLPEILSAYGYQTHAFWGSTLPSAMGEAVSESFAHAHMQDNQAEGLPSDALMQWLRKPPTEPFFVLVHDVDLHMPSQLLSAEAQHRYLPDSVRSDGKTYRQMYQQLAPRIGPEAAAAYSIARYDAALSAADQRIGSIIEAIRTAGIAEQTVVIITSDHGQDLFVHAHGDHGLLYDTVLRIPLLILDPAQAAPQVLTQQVQTIDLAPTILQRAGIPLDQGMAGQPLPGMHAAATQRPDRPILSMSNGCNISLRAGTWKLLIRDTPPASRVDGLSAWSKLPQPSSLEDFLFRARLTELPRPSCRTEVLSAAGKQVKGLEAEAGAVDPHRQAGLLSLELYDLAQDPSETLNLIQRRAHRARAKQMLTVLLGWAHERSQARPGASMSLSPEQERALKQGGYWRLVKPAGG